MTDAIAIMLKITESDTIENDDEIRQKVAADLGSAKVNEVVIRHADEQQSSVLLVCDDLAEPLTYNFEDRRTATAFYRFVWEHFAESHDLSPGGDPD